MKLVKSFGVIALAVLTCGIVSAQSSLYMPRNIKPSYDKGIRSYDGTPGKNYWQNSSDYKIKAELLTGESKLKGEEEITYYNNSPDTLNMMVIRLLGDIFKKGAARDFYRGTADMTDGVRLDYLIINGDTVSFEGRNAFRSSTNVIVRLSEPIAPSTKAEVKAKWTIEIPDTAHLRMGNYGGHYFVAYWYPQIAVYDDIDGWDRIEYTGLAEFYNDFNNYDIEITLPDDYIVWGCGEIQNIDDVLQPQIVERFNKAKLSDETIRIVAQEDYKTGVTKKSESGKNVWKYSAKKVNDFTFAACSDYDWDAASVEVEPGRRVLTMAVYPDSTTNWDQAAQHARAAIDYMSHELPGYPYPYPHTTSFCNGERGGGMESPMMTNDGAPKNLGSQVGLIFHEIAHTYLPFFMGINERKYAWMDEGWATFFPGVVVNRYAPEADYYARQVRSYQYGAGIEQEMPLTTPTYKLPPQTSRYASYSRPANAYMELQRLLGKDLFKSSMLEYMTRWHEKHPIPYDYFFTINDAAGEDLSWFWKPWFFERGYPDLKLEKVDKTDGGYSALIKNVGQIPTAVVVTFNYDDGASDTVKYNARVWKDGKEFSAEIKTDKKLKSAELGSKYIPDVDRKNNTFEMK